jgi:hypothetical protein
MGILERIALSLGILLVVGAGSYWYGYTKGYAAAEKEWRAKVAQIELSAKKEAERLREEGEIISAKLVEAQSQVKIQTMETIRYVYVKASPTRLAIRADITDELNKNSRITEKVQALPASTEETGGTSERAAAEALLTARSAFELCREQVIALAEWARRVSTPKEKP